MLLSLKPQLKIEEGSELPRDTPFFVATHTILVLMSDETPPVNIHHSINYIELPATDLAATKAFYGTVFGWEFQDWGPAYISFSGAAVEGGFEQTPVATPPSASDKGVLVVLYSDDLAGTLEAVTTFGGEIIRPTFAFPGGRRFHFLDPNGNELAVWSP